MTDVKKEPIHCELRPTTIREWLRCDMCWEIKISVTLLAVSKLLMLWGAPPTENLRWRIGIILFWLAIACLVFSLLRDFWLLATTKFKRFSLFKELRK